MHLNQYTFLNIIGRGAYAEVVLARDETSGELVGVKCFSKSRLMKKRDIRRVAGNMVVITGLDKVQVGKLTKRTPLMVNGSALPVFVLV